MLSMMNWGQFRQMICIKAAVANIRRNSWKWFGWRGGVWQPLPRNEFDVGANLLLIEDRVSNDFEKRIIAVIPLKCRRYFDAGRQESETVENVQSFADGHLGSVAGLATSWLVGSRIANVHVAEGPHQFQKKNRTNEGGNPLGHYVDLTSATSSRYQLPSKRAIFYYFSAWSCFSFLFF